MPEDDLSRRGLGEALARDQLFGLPLDERGLSLRFLGCQSLAFSGLKLVKSRLLDNRQRRTRRQCVQHHAGNTDRAAACLVLLQRRLQDRPALEYKARCLTDHAVDKRTVEQGAAAADHEPAQTLEPAAVVQRAKKSLDVGTVLDHRIDMDAVGAGYHSPGVAARQAGTGRASRQPRHALQYRQHRKQRRPEAAVTLHLGRYGGRHPLGVEIDQGERRAAIDDVGGDAGDQVRPRRAVEQHLLGRDRNLVRQIGAQAAERECL